MSEKKDFECGCGDIFETTEDLKDHKAMVHDDDPPPLTELTHMEAIRNLSGIFEDDKEMMQLRLFLCCMIARNHIGDATDDFTDQQLVKVGIKLKRFERSGVDEELAKAHAEAEYPGDQAADDRGIAYLSYLAGLAKGHDREALAWKHYLIQEKTELKGEIFDLKAQSVKMKELIREAQRVFANAPDGWAKDHTEWLLHDLAKIEKGEK